MKITLLFLLNGLILTVLTLTIRNNGDLPDQVGILWLISFAISIGLIVRIYKNMRTKIRKNNANK